MEYQSMKIAQHKLKEHYSSELHNFLGVIVHENEY